MLENCGFRKILEPWGSKYQYLQTQTTFFILINEDGGKSYNELLNDFILKPCGLTHTRIFGINQSGKE